MNQIYANIKQIRIIRNYDQVYLADQIGVTHEWYSKMENGKTNLTIDQLHKIAKVLEVDPVDFYTFKPSNMINSYNQQGGYVGNNQHFSDDKEFVTKMMELLHKISEKIK